MSASELAGASEDKDSEAKPTPPKTDSLSSLCIYWFLLKDPRKFDLGAPGLFSTKQLMFKNMSDGAGIKS